PEDVMERPKRRSAPAHREERPEPRPAEAPREAGHPVIRVVGIGGAGVNAVNRMVEAEVEGVEFLAINTDMQSLQQSTADITLHIGAGLTRGLGSGSDAGIGRAAAMEDYDHIKSLLKGSDMIFITAGAGEDVLRQGVQGISDRVTLPGLINLDFADVRTIMSDAGSALLGIGVGVGEARATEAAAQAASSPLLETSMDGARSILLSITGGTNLSLWEVNEAAKAVAEAAHPDANIIFGAMVDEKLDDPVWVTVVATRYGESRAPRRLEEPKG